MIREGFGIRKYWRLGHVTEIMTQFMYGPGKSNENKDAIYVRPRVECVVVGHPPPPQPRCTPLILYTEQLSNK